MSNLKDFIRYVFNHRFMIFELTKSDFEKRYLGSYFGIIWPFILPAITILIYWFVFRFGFKSSSVKEYPYILWLTSGMVPWFYFSDALLGGTNSICDYSFLVKKIVFKVSLLPLIKVLSAFYIHLIFLVFTVVVFGLNGFWPTVYWLQIPYYFIASSFFILSLSFITASLMVFIRDIGQIIGIFLQFGFMLTPIFWQLEQLPEQYQVWLKLNPLLYLIQGYRDCFINKIWFWEHPELSLYFWTISILIFFTGALVFTKTRPHFADVL